MCGRYVLVSNFSQIAEEFNLVESDANAFLPHGDVRPGQKSACVIAAGEQNRLLNMLWGFFPSWPKKDTAKLIINARAETLSEKATFKDSFRHRRCLIPANGFYEWSKEKNQFYFSLKDRGLLGLAGLYEDNSEQKKDNAFVIITTSPNKLVEQIHNRMPVIIPAEKQSLWLDNVKFEKAELTSLFEPYPDHEMEMHQGHYRLQQAKR